MSTALTTTTGELLPAADTLNAMMALADRVAKSGIVPNSNPATVLTLMLAGRELGIPALAAQRLIHVINGRPALSAELIAALITRDHGGAALLLEESTDKVARYSYRRREWPEGQRRTHEYTAEMAKKAGLLPGKEGSNWYKFPDAMMRARCVSAIGRIAFADTIMGMYSVDEARHMDAPDEDVDNAPTPPRVVETANGKRADAVTGEVIDNPAKHDPKVELLTDIHALLAEEPKEKVDKLPVNLAVKDMEYLHKLHAALLKSQAERKAAELAPPEDIVDAEGEPLPAFTTAGVS